MKIPPRKIVRINDVGLTLNFLQLPEEEKKLRSEEVILKAFETMITMANLKQKADTTIGLLERSIKVLEKEEAYEECSVLKDLIEAIPRVVRQIVKENKNGSLEGH